MRVRVRRHGAARRRREKKSEKDQKKLPLRILISVISVLVIAAAALVITRAVGKKSLYAHSESGGAASLEGDHSARRETGDWKERDISYKGGHYRYNEEILTFLVMGIDSREVVPDVGEVDNYLKGNQADAQFLVVLNPKKKTISLVAINRNTMTAIEFYDKDNRFLGTYEMQITLQHGYGDGRELSCRRAVRAVSNLFYNLPIHGYCAVNMGALPEINDSVGGVEVEVLEPIPGGGPELQAVGQVVTLKGEDAFHYLQYRDITVFDSAGSRLERQKQYLSRFVVKAREATKSNIGYPLKLYNTVAPYLVTDVSISEINYLAGELLGYSFQGEVYSPAGKTVMGERYEEFYVDESSLKDLIIQLFYDKIDETE